MVRFLFWRFGLALAGAFLIVGCQQSVLPEKKLRTGLSEKAVVKLVGRKPEGVQRFVLPERRDEKYAVLEYYLAPTREAPEVRHWFLFDRSGLIGYGRGGSRAARGLAYDLFYHWLAEHKLMPRMAAEKAYLKRIKGLYGASLNPLIVEYSVIRAKVMTKVDANKLSTAKAEAMIRAEFAARLGSGQRVAVFGGTKGALDRYGTMMRIGLDVSQAATIGRPGAAAPNKLIDCRRLQSEGRAKAPMLLVLGGQNKRVWLGGQYLQFDR